MINSSKQWREAVAEPFRGQGYLEFNWFPGMPQISPYTRVYCSRTSGGSHYDPGEFSCFNGNAFGDDIASFEDARWLLNGKKHSTHLYNKSTRDLELNEVPGSSYLLKWINYNLAPSLSDISRSNGNDLIVGGTPIERIYPDGSIGTKQYYPLAYNDIGIYVDFAYNDSSMVIKTNKITFIWDPANKTGPVHFTVHLYRNGSQVRNISIVNTGSTMDYKADEWFNVIDLGQEVSFDAMSLDTPDWCRPNCGGRIAHIGFGDLVTDTSEDLLLTRAEIEKSSSMLLNENPTLKCTLYFDNTSRFLDPLGETGLVKNIVKGAPFFTRWAMDTLEGEHLQTEPEGWFIAGYEASSDSNEFKLILGYEGDFMCSDYFPDADKEGFEPLTPVGVWDWMQDALYTERSQHIKEPEEWMDSWEKLKALHHSFMENTNAWAVHSRTTTGYPAIGTVQETLRDLAQIIGYFITKNNDTGYLFFKPYEEVDRVITEDNLLGSPKIYSDEAVTSIEANKYIRELYSTYIDAEIKPEQEDVGHEILVPFGHTDITRGGKKITCDIIGWPEAVWAADVGAYITARSGRQGKAQILRVDGDDATASFHVYGRKDKSQGGGREYPKLYTYKVADNVESKVLTVDNKFITSDAWLTDTVNYVKRLVSKPKMIEFKCTGFPEVEPGDLLKVYTEYGNYKVLVHKNNISFNGGFEGTIEGRIMEVI